MTPPFDLDVRSHVVPDPWLRRPLETAVVVTQSAYVARAADLGDAAGIATKGYVVREGGRRGREVLARVRGLAQATWRPDVVGCPTLPITGDGRASWAENDPTEGSEPATERAAPPPTTSPPEAAARPVAARSP